MKRVLIISYYWPPTGGSGVQRWVKFCKYLPSEGWQPVVYTPANPRQIAVDNSLLSEIPECAEVLKTTILEPYSIYGRFLHKSPSSAEINPLNARKKSWKQKLAVWVRGNFFIPDPRVTWVRPSVRFLLSYLEEHPVDAVVTTGPPHSMHLIGLGLRRALKKQGKEAPRWLVDFRDPWTELFYFKHMGLSRRSAAKHRRMEQEVLDECDAVISVTPRVQADFIKKTETPVHLITNGYDEDDFTGESAVSERFTLTHTGLFASDGNPETLWKVLKEKCDSDAGFREALEIRLAGKVDAGILSSLEDYGLGGNTVRLGYLDHDITTREQRSASVLLLPLRKEPEYSKVYPGKIFEYIAARRPVLGIGQEDGAAAELLERYGCGKMLDWDNEDGLREFISVRWESHKSGETFSPSADIRALSRRSLTADLAEIL